MNQSISPDQLKLMAAMVSEIMGTPVSLDHSPVDFLRMVKDYLGILILESPGHLYWKDKDGKYLGCNANMAKSIGLKSPKEIVGLTDLDLAKKLDWPIEMGERFQRQDQEIINHGKAQLDVEDENVKNITGKKQTLLASKIPLKNNKGDIIGVMGISIDITERKQMEKQIREHAVETARLEENVRTMRIFAGGIAHELRTPLASMVNAASGIVKFMPRLVESYNMAKEANLDVPLIRKEHLEILKDTAEHIVQGGEYSQTVITAMLVTAQTAAIDTAKFKNLFMIATIQTALTTFYYPNPDDKALVHFIAENDFQFWGDETYMMDVIYNLVKNALFFIHQAQKGEITIWIENQKDKNIVYVKDTSVGIPKENLPRLFEGYFTTREAGTGVGLPLVRRLMQSFNGDITCESVEGEYTMFMLTFPIVATE
ncbi:MAG: PAS domain-containing sensor histidine kinase [Pseudomonadota bacterium]